jgi:tetratricopeptide (TPR) repeat protein
MNAGLSRSNECWWAIAAAAALLTTAIHGRAAAQTESAVGVDPDASYEQAIDAALERYAAHDWAAAGAAFERAHALRPGARTLRGVALSAYYAGDYVAAVEAFEQALAENRHALTPEQRAEVRDLLARSYHHVAQVRVQVVPASAAIRIEERSVASDERVLLAPERYALEVTSPGHEPHARTIELSAGQQLNLYIELAPVRRATVSSAPVPSNARDHDARLSAAAAPPSEPSAAIAPWIAGSATLATGASALVFALMAEDELDELQLRCDRAAACDATTRAELWGDSPIETYATLTNVSLVVTAVGAVATAALFLLAPAETLGGARSAPMLASSPNRMRLAIRF